MQNHKIKIENIRISLLERLIRNSPNNLTKRYYQQAQKKGEWVLEITQFDFLYAELTKKIIYSFKDTTAPYFQRVNIWRVLKSDDDACSNGCTQRCLTCGHCACDCSHCLRYRIPDYNDVAHTQRCKHHNNRVKAVETAIIEKLWEERPILFLKRYKFPYLEELIKVSSTKILTLSKLAFYNLPTNDIRFLEF